MEYDISILKNCPLFNQIKESEYSLLLSCVSAYKKKYKSGEFILHAGDTVSYVGILLSGSLELMKENQAGVKHILDFMGPSQMFGEGIVCTNTKISSVSVQAKEDSEIIFIPYDRIIRTCSSSCGFHHQIIKNMLLLLGEKNRILNSKIELLSLKGMREKIASYLLLESKKQNSHTFQIIPNRNELAEYLNVSRSSMCRELGRMKDLGIIDYYQNSFKIMDKKELEDCLL